MVGVCFVGLLFLSSHFLSSEETSTTNTGSLFPAMSSPSFDAWTRSDGEEGAFLVPASDVSFSGGNLTSYNYEPSISSTGENSEVSLAPVDESNSLVNPLFFEEPDFVCEYLSHPTAFGYCRQIGEQRFMKHYFSRDLSRPLPSTLLSLIFST